MPWIDFNESPPRELRARPASLPGGIINPTYTMLARAGIVYGDPAQPPAPGMVRVASAWVRGVTRATQAVNDVPEAEHAASLAASRAAAEAWLARDDAMEHAPNLRAVLALAEAVPEIAPGDTVEACAAKSLEASRTRRDAGDLAASQIVSDTALAALAAFGELRAAGVTGDRLWRALAAFQQAGAPG